MVTQRDMEFTEQVMLIMCARADDHPSTAIKIAELIATHTEAAVKEAVAEYKRVVDATKQTLATGFEGWFGDIDPNGDRENGFWLPLNEYEKLCTLLAAIEQLTKEKNDDE